MAKGSHAIFDGYPRVCSGCDEKVVMGGIIPLWFETLAGVMRSWHFDCRMQASA